MADLTVRKSPCASCPYRCDVPSGLWDAEEYAKLPLYDGDIGDQVQHPIARRLFHCHQQDGSLCAGWIGHRDDPVDLLAVRLAVTAGWLDAEEVEDFHTDVALWPTGALAAEHGLRDVLEPGEDAMVVIGKLRAARAARQR